MEGLYNAFPQDTDELIESAADPLGREFLARLTRTNSEAGRYGLKWIDLKKYIEAHLNSLSVGDRRLLTEQNVHRKGFGAFKRPPKGFDRERPRDHDRTRDRKDDIQAAAIHATPPSTHRESHLATHGTQASFSSTHPTTTP